MTIDEKIRIKAIYEQIEILKKEAEKINPFISWPEKSNKEFGEKYSEEYILSKTPNLQKNHGAGHDMKGTKYNNIEVKSSRMKMTDKWTMNQLHPDKADAYLFVWYDCNEGTQEICFIPTEDLLNYCSYNLQHGAGCFSMGSTKKNRDILKNYIVTSWKELNEKV